MDAIDWCELCSASGTQESFDLFHNRLTALHNKHFPKVRIKRRYNNKKPWLTEALRISIKHKNKLYYIYQKVKSVSNELNYKRYKSKLQNILKKAEKAYFHDLLLNHSNDIRKSWVIIKGIIHKNRKEQVQTKFKLQDGNVTAQKAIISNKFNDFFVNIGPTLSKAIPSGSKLPTAYLGDMIKETIFLTPVDSLEVKNIILSLKNSAAGHDDVGASLLKLSIEHIVAPLTHICNLSLSEGVFPDQLKIANVVPLYKAEDSMMFNNYRPVSVLCVLSKIFEKIMFTRVQVFLNELQILYKYQFGFRKGHSTYMAHIVLMDKLIHAMENGEYVIGIYLDFSKAFDTVNHAILLDKLHHYGIRGVAHSWFKNYLTNRHQFVTYNGAKSKLKVINCGVPQGSILGPLLFLIYINDLVSVCKSTMPIMFADDTSLFASGTDIHVIEDTINKELSNISTWLKVNRLSLNVKKTHFMMFTNKRYSIAKIEIKIDNEPIEETTKTKFLGVIIDNKLTWKDHIMYISGKISRGMGIIIKSRKFLYKQTLLNLYYSFIYPYFIYCNQVWGNTYKTYLQKLTLLQKRIIRIIAGVHPLTHTDPLFMQFNILKFAHIHSFLIGRLMYRVYHGTLELFQGYFLVNSDIHNYLTRQTDHYHLPFFHTDLGKSSLRYYGAVLWNNIILSEVTYECSEYVFCKKLKHKIMLGQI